jgi:SAM-dependent methyltransferase
MLGPLRRFLQRRAGGDQDAELRFWLDQWEPHIRSGLLFSPNGLELCGDPEVADTYEGRRWQEARAQVHRVLQEAGIDDPDFFSGRVVLEIGPGPVGLPDACGARVALAVEPLADRMREVGLLLGGDAAYLTCGAEALPLLGDSVDVVVARNSLDHVRDPGAVLSETTRVLRPGGTLILNVDIEGQATAEEPHAFTVEDVRRLLGPLEIERERVLPEPHGHVGRQLVIVAAKPEDGT